MADIQIIFFDIDGTLLDHRTGCISPKTKEALLRLHQKGIKICVATGRPIASLPDLGGLPFDAISVFNGSLSYTEKETIHSTPIGEADIQQVLRNAKKLGRPVSIAVRDRLVANGIDEDLAEYYRQAGLVLTAAEDFDAAFQENIYQIMLGCRAKDYETILADTTDVKLAVSWDRAADVIPASCGKGSAIGKVLAYFGLDASQAMAFGDSYNDIEMMAAVGSGVAMGNAPDALKAVASDVCGPVFEDGIYHYCVEHGLI